MDKSNATLDDSI